MFIVLLKYAAPLEQIDYALPDHRAWVEKQYERGLFLASGRQVPRTGGVRPCSAMQAAMWAT